MDDDEFDIYLVERMHDSDRVAFETLFERHAGSVLRYAWALVADVHEAEDLVQETFITCWSKRRTVIVLDESLLPWLLTVCKNHARNLWRKKARQQRLLSKAAVEKMTSSADDLLWVREALDELSVDDRRIIELCLIQGFSYKEAAIQLEVTEATVGKRLQRARTRMREAVNEHDQ